MEKFSETRHNLDQLSEDVKFLQGTVLIYQFHLKHVFLKFSAIPEYLERLKHLKSDMQLINTRVNQLTSRSNQLKQTKEKRMAEDAALLAQPATNLDEKISTTEEKK